jgi:serine protease Do
MNRLSAALALGLGISGLAGYCASPILYGSPAEAIRRGAEPVTYRGLVKHVLPAVVTIESTMKPAVSKTRMPHQKLPFDIPGLPDELRKRFEENQEPEDATPAHGLGSGFIADPEGLVVTNNHVVQGANHVEVVLQDGRRYIGTNIKTDPKTDMAIVHIKADEPLPYLEWGNSDDMEIGDRVLAVGSPLGMTGSVTSGIISAKGRDIHMNQYEDFLQTDAAINPGNSGGPLVNLDGKVIGVNSAIKSRTGGFQGIGLAISSNLARNVMENLQKDGTVHRGYLGVQIQPLEAEVAARLGVPGKTGVVVGKVFPNTPAAKAGLQDGDIITSLTGKKVKDGRELQRLVAGLPLGKAVALTIFRDGATKTLEIAIEEQPRSYGVASANGSEENGSESMTLDKIGAKVTDLSPDAAKELHLPSKSQGALVTEVDPDGIAARAGLKKGTLIEKVDQKLVKSAQEAQSALDRGSLEKGILLQVKSPAGGTSYVLLKA